MAIARARTHASMRVRANGTTTASCKVGSYCLISRSLRRVSTCLQESCRQLRARSGIPNLNLKSSILNPKAEPLREQSISRAHALTLDPRP